MSVAWRSGVASRSRRSTLRRLILVEDTAQTAKIVAHREPRMCPTVGPLRSKGIPMLNPPDGPPARANCNTDLSPWLIQAAQRHVFELAAQAERVEERRSTFVIVNGGQRIEARNDLTLGARLRNNLSASECANVMERDEVYDANVSR
jgi:hypothetical protein